MDDETKTEDTNDATAQRLTALEAKLEAEMGKSAGILEGKKKAQAQAEALQAKIDALESKDLGEVETLKRDMERLQSKLELTESQKTELQTTYESEKRNHALNKVAGEFNWMDTVPKDMQSLIVSNALEGIDLGNEVLVADKIKSIRETYAGQLASDAPSGAGSRPGNATANQQGASMDKIMSMSDADILANPAKFLMDATAANQ